MHKLVPAGQELLRSEKSEQSVDSVFCIAGRVIEPALNRISNEGQTIQVEPKVMQVLISLVEQSGRVVTREHLLETVWADSFVSEEALTRCISELRKMMGDDPKNSRVIETIRKTGYRLIAPVQPFKQTGELSSQARAAESLPPEAKHMASMRFVWIAALVIVVLSISLFIFRSSSVSPAPSFRTVPLTRYPGREIDPALSADGQMLAFVWDGKDRDNFDIYVKPINSETPLRLTTDEAADRAPVFSPDGQQIAFVRLRRGESEVLTVPALGGPERLIARCEFGCLPSLAWSPDGKHLAYSERVSPSTPYSIFLISIESGEKMALTTPPSLYEGDSLPAFSPDGQTLAFLRARVMGITDIFIVPVSGGQSRRITFDNLKISGIDWTQDGSEIIFSSNRVSNFNLWKIPARGGASEGLPGVGEDAYRLSASRQKERLAYMHWIVDTNIWRQEITDGGAQSGAHLLIASTRWDSHPQYSPDGKRVAFASTRSGAPEIWVCDSDGLNPVQLTSNGGPFTGSPHWSPDGSRIVFESRVGADADIYVMNADGTSLRRLTAESSDDLTPVWSKDGRWIYFISNRSGNWQVWKMAAGGGTSVQMTLNGGIAAAESVDGKTLYFCKADEPGLWKMPVEGGQESLVLDSLEGGRWNNWAVTDRGVFLVSSHTDEGSVLEFFNFATRRVSKITSFKKPVSSGLSISGDGRSLLFTLVDRAEGDIMLLEGFR